MVGVGLPAVFYYAVHFYRLYEKESIIGQNLCLIISAIFLWGLIDIFHHYKKIMKEHSFLEKFKTFFPTHEEKKLIPEFQKTIIGKRFQIICRLKESLSEVSHEILTDIISASESQRAIFAKYFLGACVLLGLLGTFLGLMEIISGAYLAIDSVTASDLLSKSLHQPLSGMSLAFGTSVLGIVASLALGFSYLFFYRRQLTFIIDLEEFTQTMLIPMLTKPQGKILEEINNHLEKIKNASSSVPKTMERIADEIGKALLAVEEKNANLLKSVYSSVSEGITRLIDQETKLQTKTMQNIENNLKQQVTRTHALLLQQTEKSFASLSGQWKEVSLSIQGNLQKNLAEWTKIFKKEFSENTFLIQKNLGQINRQSIDKSEALYQKNLELFDTSRREFKILAENLQRMHETFQKSMDHTTASLGESINQFNEIIPKEQKKQELMINQIEQLTTIFDAAGHLLQSNQAELKANLTMFVQGIDKILEYFYSKTNEEHAQNSFIEQLETSLTLFHERASDVLMEYAARSREVLSGVLENQLHLNQEIRKIK